jgi:RNA recognition motif. (a.k.a. RRM, RBD, or RNP domain)
LSLLSTHKFVVVVVVATTTAAATLIAIVGTVRNQAYSAFQNSPHTQGLPMYTMPSTRPGRAYSLEEMLPPSALDHDPSGNPAYSPYNSSTTSSAAQTWNYTASGAPELQYTGGISSGMPLQPRSSGVPLPYVPGGMRSVGQYNASYFPASSPGPPIQTTASNKGPDGANLFIFHIPNHFTNVDMFHLFCPYGNLLSVRIMVEKDSGRSRGFGFVSYDSPESAALAIKELNGFAVSEQVCGRTMSLSSDRPLLTLSLLYLL